MMETSLTELYTTIALFKRQPHKIAKHTQKIHWLLPTNCLSVLNHFVELALKGLKNRLKIKKWIHYILLLPHVYRKPDQILI